VITGQRVIAVLLLLVLVIVCAQACAAPSQAGGNFEDSFNVFEKTLPSGKVVECVSWHYSNGPLQCFPK
jgi:hypothetical protein